MNRPITSTEIESVILKLPKNKVPGPEGFTGKTFREELTPIFLKLFLKKCRGRNTSLFIVWSHLHSDNKTSQRYHTKKKITGQYHWWT